MKSVKVLLGLVCFFFATTLTVSSYPFYPVDENTWRYYMSTPRDQNNEGYENFSCYAYAIVGCLEGIYNQIAGLNGTTKVRLRLDDQHYSNPYETLSNISGYPNYNGAVSFGYSSIKGDVARADLQSWLKYTPVCVKINSFDSSDYSEWDSGDPPINWEDKNGGFHWMVCVGCGTYNGKDFYRFFNQMGENWADSGFIDIYDDGDMADWYGGGAFPVIYNTIESVPAPYIDQDNINFSLVPQIYPAFFPNSCTIPNEGDNTCTINGTVYIAGDFIISGSDNKLVLGNNTVVKFETSQKTPNEGNYLTKNEIIVSGALSVGDNVTFQSIASSPSWGDWGQIKVLGILDIGDNVTISDATIGLNIESNYITCPTRDGLNPTKCTISNCFDWGMLITAGETIQNIEFDGNGDRLYYGSLCSAGAGSGPTINYVTFTDTGFGVCVNNYANVALTRCNFNNSVHADMIKLYNSSSSSLDIDDGQNNFLYTSNGNWHAISNLDSDYITADYNFWNNQAEDLLFEYPAKIIRTYIDSTQYNDAGACKAVSTIAQGNPFIEGRELENNGRLNAARDIYRQVLSTSDDPHDKSMAIKSLIRTCEVDSSVANMQECSSAINEQISSADDWYKELLEYLLCDLAVKEAQKERRASALSEEEQEAQYRDSIAKAANQFIMKSDEYSGSPMQVEMLSRAAVLYGDYLGDRSQAKICADKAASINPGQPILYVAYLSAACEYDPWLYIDKYSAEEIPDQPFESNSADGIDISLSPNPFNPSTVLTYSLNAPSHVKITVYSINGQKVTELTDAYTSAGRHSVVFDGSKNASGVYFYRFTSSSGIKTGKMLLIK